MSTQLSEMMPQPRKRKKQPSKAKAKPSGTKAQPSKAKAQPSKAKAQPSETKVQPSKAKAQPSGTKAQPSKAKAQPSETKVQPGKAKAQPSETKVQPSKAKAQPSKAKAQPSKAKAQPSKAKAQPSETKVQPGKAKAQPSETKVQPSKRKSVDPDTGEGLLIEREAFLPRVRRAVQYGWGAASWLVLLDLLRPLLSGLLWIAGAGIAKRSLFSNEGLRYPEFYLYYPLVILGIFLIFLGWNRYNALRFRGPDRRRNRSECEPSEFARYYDISIEEVDALHGADVEISFLSDESILIETGSGQKISALYAPQNLKRHMVRLEGRNETAKVLVTES